MTERQIKLITGALLHDIGKVLYRGMDGRNHSESGYHFLKEETKIDSREILDQVRYHHGKHLRAADIEKDSLAYITYIADNIAAALDRRKKENGERGFLKEQPLESVFNILNGNQEKKVYRPMMLGEKEGINNPEDEWEGEYSKGFYIGVAQQMKMCLTDFQWEAPYLNALLEILESTVSFIPSSTSKDELADISLYDHSKMTAAVASCIYEYLEEQGIKDYKKELFQESDSFYSKEVFYLYSMDISGIQDFIYTIASKGALKGLRSRSFYLEIMMEHLIDSLLEKIGLSRANLIYSGGGHAYILLPNTERARKTAEQFEKDTNQWFLKMFETDLYVAGGGACCSARSFWNEPEGAYSEIFRRISRMISEKKLHRYTPEQVISLNQKKVLNQERECKICRRTDFLSDDEEECEICRALKQMSGAILYQSFFTVTRKKQGIALPLPGDCYLVADSEASLRKRIKAEEGYVRSYSKNKAYVGRHLATRLWVGDYVEGDTFEELGNRSEGIRRIAVMRADVDNLGQAFVRGFENEQYGNRYVTLSRTATFSRKLSMFFKYHINYLLKHGSYNCLEASAYADTDTGEIEKKRDALIVYSGGDDVFIVGSWNDVIGFAIDLYDSLKEYSQDTLQISAGIGIYPAKYPISVMARETGKLEDASKSFEGKNAVTIFDEQFTFHWADFIEGVLEEKFWTLKDYFSLMEDRGKSFLYHLLDLLRKRKEDRINIARFAYLLGRMEPQYNHKEDAELFQEKKKSHQMFSKQMYKWIRSQKDAKELEMAIYLYTYMTRKEEEGQYGVDE